MCANPFCLLGMSEKSRAAALMWSSGVCVFFSSSSLSCFCLGFDLNWVQVGGFCFKLWNYSTTKWSQESRLGKTKCKVHEVQFSKICVDLTFAKSSQGASNNRHITINLYIYAWNHSFLHSYALFSHPTSSRGLLPPPASNSKQVFLCFSPPAVPLSPGEEDCRANSRRCSQELGEAETTKPDLWRNIKHQQDCQHRQPIARKERKQTSVNTQAISASRKSAGAVYAAAMLDGRKAVLPVL